MSTILFFLLAVFSFFLSLLTTYLVKLVATKLDLLDKPGKERKIHNYPIPLMGGMAIFLSYFLILFFFRDKILSGNLEVNHWLGFFIGACFLMIGGFLDDKYNLSAKQQIVWPILAAFSVIIGGVSIEKITNPFGGFFYLQLISPIIIFIWLMGMMYTTKLLDGIDGLVTSITGIGSLIIFLFTQTTKYYQPDIGFAALVLAATCLGFLFFNWYPAKIFLGEGGSLLLGYLLGVIAIISGGKIAIALLIMAIPIMDVIWTILRRLHEGKNPFKFADRKHLHFRLFDAGLNQWQVVLFYCSFALVFGINAIFLQSQGKIFSLILLVFLMLILIFSLNYLERRKRL